MSVERAARTVNGWPMLIVDIALYAGAAALFVLVQRGDVNAGGESEPVRWMLVSGRVLFRAIVVSLGFFTLQPNEARVLILFGDYKGTAARAASAGAIRSTPTAARRAQRRPGAQALGKRPRRRSRTESPETLGRYKISLRARTLNGDRLKVNDKRGNPVEIAAVVVWRVEDTAKAVFDVEDYETYVPMQSESALRHVASAYAYDHGESGSATRSRCAATSTRSREALQASSQERLAKAGVVVERGAAHPPRLRAGDRPGDAPPPAGRGDHRRAPQDRHGRREHGRDGAAGTSARTAWSSSTRSARPRWSATSGGALRREPRCTPVVNTGTLYK